MNVALKTSQMSVPQNENWIPNVKAKARYNVENYGSCTQAILAAFMDEFNLADPVLMRSAGAMYAGMTASLTCGVHTAGLMILGLFMGREDIAQSFDGMFPIFLPAQKLLKRLNGALGSDSCRELTGVDFTDLDQALKFQTSLEHQKCIARVADGAEVIATVLKELERNEELFRP